MNYDIYDLYSFWNNLQVSITYLDIVISYSLITTKVVDTMSERSIGRRLCLRDGCQKNDISTNQELSWSCWCKHGRSISRRSWWSHELYYWLNLSWSPRELIYKLFTKAYGVLILDAIFEMKELWSIWRIYSWVNVKDGFINCKFISPWLLLLYIWSFAPSIYYNCTSKHSCKF